MAQGTRIATRVKIERPALLLRLNERPGASLVTMTAGAGFGKTTVATLWDEHDTRRHVVVRVGPFMDDAHVLALSLVDALESLGVSGALTREVLTASEPRFSAIALPALCRLASAVPEPFVLVVDDLHLLGDPDCHALLQALSEAVPPGSTLALLTRADVPGWVARARTETEVLELGPPDLAFTEDESREFLRQLGWAPDDERVQVLVEQAEGWPVGLYLMALAAGGPGSDAAPRVGPFGSDRYVLDYIRGEVLTGLPARSRDFLRRTSVVEEQDTALCDALIRRQDSGRELAALSHRLQLVIPLDATGHRYRYHHLLGAALRLDLAEQEPWLEAELHARASGWYEQAGRWDEAVRHAVAAGEVDRTSRLVWAGVPACIASGKPDRLRIWLGGVDPAQVRADRWLTLASAWLALQSGDPDRMTEWLLAADEHAGPGWTQRVSQDEYAASVAAIHVLVGDHGLRGTLDLCRGVQAALPRDSGFRASAMHNEGVVLTLLGHRDEGQERLVEAVNLARALHVPIIEANALAWQGVLALMDDDWAVGAPLVADVAELVQGHRLERLATSVLSITAVSFLNAARGDKAEARFTLGTARRLTQQVSRIAPWFGVTGPLVQCRTALLLGDITLARALCRQAREHLVPDLATTALRSFVEDTERLLGDVGTAAVDVSALTPAELRVLQYLPSRLTFPQIGEHLFISQNTVKTHAIAIYRKLGTSSRDAAVARARTLGLVESPPSA